MITLRTTPLMNIEKMKADYPVIPEITLIRTALVEVFHAFAERAHLSREAYLKIKRTIFRIFKLSYYNDDVSPTKVANIIHKLSSFEPVLRSMYRFNVATVMKDLHTLSKNPHREKISHLVCIERIKSALCSAVDDYCLQLKQFSSVALMYLEGEEDSPLKRVLSHVSKFKKPKDFSLSKKTYSEEVTNYVELFRSALIRNNAIRFLLERDSQTKLSELHTVFVMPIHQVTRDLLVRYQEMRTRLPS